MNPAPMMDSALIEKGFSNVEGKNMKNFSNNLSGMKNPILINMQFRTISQAVNLAFQKNFQICFNGSINSRSFFFPSNMRKGIKGNLIIDQIILRMCLNSDSISSCFLCFITLS